MTELIWPCIYTENPFDVAFKESHFKRCEGVNLGNSN